MSEAKKSTFRQMADAVQRFKSKADSARERGEMIAGEVLRTGLSAGTSFAAGLVDQRFGEADAETGIRVHRTNGAPTALLAGAAAKVAAGFGLFGKFDTVGFAAGDGAVGAASNTWGRMAGERLRKREERAPASKETTKEKKAA